MTIANPLIRQCISCGIEKSISAFLHLTGAKGTTYGNICSSCRNTSATMPKRAPEPEEETSSGSGLKIDAKTKVHSAQENKQLAKKINEIYEEEKLQDKLHESKLLDAKTIAKTAQERHNDLIEAKKSGHLFNRKINTASDRQRFTLQQTSETIEQQDAATKQDLQEKTIDLSQSPNLGLQKYIASPIFNQFKDRLGASAFINLGDKKFQQKATPIVKEEKDPLIKTVEETWGPSSRKR